MAKSFAELEIMVDDVYQFRDHYYKSHPTASSEAKRQDIMKKAESVMIDIAESLESNQDETTGDKLKFLHAKLLNLNQHFHSESEVILTRHVKLHPYDTEAWNILGECFWKKGDLMNAQNCFNRSAELTPNSFALRSSSMLLRNLGKTSDEITSYLQKSLEKAREALALDIQDGKNWYVLGNVYIAMYFKTDQNIEWLKKCVKAYTNAFRHENVQNDADFHFNRGVAFSYYEDYGKALEAYVMASQCDPNWIEPKTYKANLETFVINCQESIDTKGKIKERRLKSLLKSLKTTDIGPYSDYYTKSMAGGTVQVPLTRCGLHHLNVGENPNMVVLGKVICHIYSPDPVTFAFCMIDDEGPCRAVNVYNIAEGRGVKIGDSVAIPEPLLSRMDFQFNGKKFKFDWIKVDNPLLLVINGRPMSPDSRAVPVLNLIINPEF